MFSNPDQNIAEFGIGEGMKVADLGAGAGFYSIAAARKVGNSGFVYAVEVQKTLVDKIKSNAIAEGIHNIEAIWGNIEKIGGTKLREAMADRVIVSNVLFQIEQKDRDNFCLEAKRITKPGGKILIIDWNAVTPLGPKEFITKAAAQSLFEKAGFKYEREFDAGDHHYGLVMTR